jgi:tetrahydromethanopterin S-methyltransferase subunit E
MSEIKEEEVIVAEAYLHIRVVEGDPIPIDVYKQLFQVAQGIVGAVTSGKGDVALEVNQFSREHEVKSQKFNSTFDMTYSDVIGSTLNQDGVRKLDLR